MTPELFEEILTIRDLVAEVGRLIANIKERLADIEADHTEPEGEE
jgi:hypothetical protein